MSPLLKLKDRKSFAVASMRVNRKAGGKFTDTRDARGYEKLLLRSRACKYLPMFLHRDAYRTRTCQVAAASRVAYSQRDRITRRYQYLLTYSSNGYERGSMNAFFQSNPVPLRAPGAEHLSARVSRSSNCSPSQRAARATPRVCTYGT